MVIQLITKKRDEEINNEVLVYALHVYELNKIITIPN